MRHLERSKTPLAMVEAYAKRQGMRYNTALAELVHMAGDHDNAIRFLHEAAMDIEYLQDARLIMDEAKL